MFQVDQKLLEAVFEDYPLTGKHQRKGSRCVSQGSLREAAKINKIELQVNEP